MLQRTLIWAKDAGCRRGSLCGTRKSGRSLASSAGRASALVNRKLCQAGSTEAVLALAWRHSRALDGVNLLTALRRLVETEVASSSDAQQPRSPLRPHQRRGMPHYAIADDQRFLALASDAGAAMHIFTPCDVAAAAYAFAKLRLPAGQMVWITIGDALVEFSRSRRLPGRDAAQTLWAMSSVRCLHAPALELLASPASIKTLDAHGISSVMWAMATVSYAGAADEFLDACAAHAQSPAVGFHAFSDQGLSNVAWATAVLARQTQDSGAGLLVGIQREAANRVETGLSPKAHAGVLKASVKARVTDEDAFAALLHGTAERADFADFDGQSLTQVLWVAAATRLQQPLLFSRASAVLMNRIGTLSGQQIADVLVTLGTARDLDIDWFTRSRTRVAQLTEQGLACRCITDIAWAYGLLGPAHMDLSSVVLGLMGKAALSRHRLHEFSHHQAASLMKTFATAGHDSAREVVCALADSAATGLQASPKALADMLWATAVIRIRHASLLTAAAGAVSHAREGLAPLSERELGRLSWAFAEIRGEDVGCSTGGGSSSSVLGCFASNLAEEVLRRGTSSFEPPVLAKVVLALAVCGACSAELMVTVHLDAKHWIHAQPAAVGARIWLATAASVVEQVGISRYAAVRSDLLETHPHLRRAERALHDAGASDGILRGAVSECAEAEACVEDLSRRVPALAERHGLGKLVTSHALDSSGSLPLLMDAALPERKVALEVGAHAFTVSDVATGALLPCGPSLLRHRILERSGWQLVHISAQAWASLTGKEARDAYLLRLLGDACRAAPTRSVAQGGGGA